MARERRARSLSCSPRGPPGPKGARGRRAGEARHAGVSRLRRRRRRRLLLFGAVETALRQLVAQVACVDADRGGRPATAASAPAARAGASGHPEASSPSRHRGSRGSRPPSRIPSQSAPPHLLLGLRTLGLAPET